MERVPSSGRGVGGWVTELRIVLIGLRASGKSSVGRLLATRLGATFFDSDNEIERRSGRSPALWIEQQGEAQFREFEAQVVLELAEAPAPVVLALGGGAPLSSESRRALDGWHAILLDVPIELLVERIERDRQQGKLRPALTEFSTLEEMNLQRSARWTDYMDMAPRVVSTGTSSSESVEGLAQRLQQLLES